MVVQDDKNTKPYKTWTKIYLLVIGVLLLIIFLLYFFTQHYS
jgi:hypothetical protein